MNTPDEFGGAARYWYVLELSNGSARCVESDADPTEISRLVESGGVVQVFRELYPIFQRNNDGLTIKACTFLPAEQINPMFKTIGDPEWPRMLNVHQVVSIQKINTNSDTWREIRDKILRDQNVIFSASSIVLPQGKTLPA